MHIEATATTEEILAELGERMRRYRLQQNRTAQDVADATGLKLLTIQRAERGSNPTLDTVIRILRALNRLDALEAFLPVPLASPLELVKLSGRERKRAGTPRQKKNRKESRGDD